MKLATNNYYDMRKIHLLLFLFVVNVAFGESFICNGVNCSIQEEEHKGKAEDLQSSYATNLTVANNNAGELSDVLPLEVLINLDSLTIQGDINDTDIKYLRDNTQRMEYLNLADASIKKGGAYVDKRKSYSSQEDNHVYDRMFQNLRSLKTIILPSSITHIGDYAFSGCSNLSKITIPHSVRHIGIEAFYRCQSLRTFAVPDSVTIINHNTFYGCDSITSVLIHNEVTKIGNKAFAHCPYITSITLPSKLHSVGVGGFTCCDRLKNIHSNIANIQACEFKYVFGWEDYGIDDGTYTQFLGIPKNCTWHVPIGTTEDYKGQPWWESTWQIVEDIEQ